MSATISMVFNGMNNVADPSDISFDARTSRYSEAVDLVNVDVDNDGGVSVRARRTLPLTKTDSVTVEGVKVLAGSQVLTHGAILPFDRDEVVEYAEGHFDTWFAGGDSIDYYNGCIFRGGLLEGIGAVLQSKPYEYDIIDSRYHVAYLAGSEITMIGAVDDGVYIGTQNEVVFLSGDGSIGNGFTVKDVFPYGVIKGTRERTTGHKVPAANMTGSVVVFATHNGVVVGGSGGNAVNLSYGRVSYPHGVSGSSLLREENGLVHYVFIPNTGIDADNPYTPPNIATDESSV